MNVVELLAASAAVLVAATVQGAVGIGYALVSAPLLALIDPRLVPGPILVTSVFLTASSALRERAAIDWSGVGWTTAGRLPGSLLGAALFAMLARDTANVAIAFTLLAAVALTASGLRFEASPRTWLGAGLLSGVMGTISSAGGPPLALLYQHEPGPRLRSTLGVLLFVGVVISVAALALVGHFGWWELRSGLLLVPGLLLGFWLSGRLTQRLDRGHTRRAVLLVAGISGGALLLRELLN